MKVRDILTKCAFGTLVHFNLPNEKGFTVRIADYGNRNFYTVDSEYRDFNVVGIKAIRENEIVLWIDK